MKLINKESLIDRLNQFAPEKADKLVNAIILREPEIDITDAVPFITEADRKKIAEAKKNGFAFIETDLIKKLMNESAELAALKAEKTKKESEVI